MVLSIRQFLVNLDAIQAREGNYEPLPTVSSVGSGDDTLPASIEDLLSKSHNSNINVSQNNLGSNLKDFFWKSVSDYILMPRKSPLAFFSQSNNNKADASLDEDGCHGGVHVLRGWLSEPQTRELLALMEETKTDLHGVILAAGLAAVSRTLTSEDQAHDGLRVANELNLRHDMGMAKVGAFSTSYEAEFDDVGKKSSVTSRSDFWRLAHDLSVKHDASERSFVLRKRTSGPYLGVDMGVASYGNLNLLFRKAENSQQIGDSWSRPLSEVDHQTHIRLEDVFHVVNVTDLGVPFRHTAHILHGKLNYIMTYDTKLVRNQRYAFMVRDEVINLLRMAVDEQQD